MGWLAKPKDSGRTLIRNWGMEQRNVSIVKDNVLETADVQSRYSTVLLA